MCNRIHCCCNVSCSILFRLVRLLAAIIADLISQIHNLLLAITLRSQTWIMAATQWYVANIRYQNSKTFSIHNQTNEKEPAWIRLTIRSYWNSNRKGVLFHAPGTHNPLPSSRLFFAFANSNKYYCIRKRRYDSVFHFHLKFYRAHY